MVVSRTARGSSSPAPTPTPCGSSTSRRRRRPSRSRSRSYPARPPGSTPNAPRRSRPTAGRCSSPTPTTTPSRSWTSSTAGREPGRRASSRPAGIRPASLFTATARGSSCSAGKGLTSHAEPARPAAGRRRGDQSQYIGAMLPGSLSVLPDARPPPRSRAYTKTVRRADAVHRRARLTPAASAPPASPIPRRSGDAVADQARLLRHPREPHLRPGPRRHAEGQRRSGLCLFGEDVTPNAHALAREFVLARQLLRQRRGQLRRARVLDRRLRHRLRREDLADQLRPAAAGSTCREGGGKMRNPYGNVDGAGRTGYIWDAARAGRRHVPQLRRVRAARRERGGRGRRPVRSRSVPGLDGHMHPTYPPCDLAIPDGQRVDVWLEEFREFESERQPAAAVDHSACRNDHTAGTRAGHRRRRAR